MPAHRVIQWFTGDIAQHQIRRGGGDLAGLTLDVVQDDLAAVGGQREGRDPGRAVELYEVLRAGRVIDPVREAIQLAKKDILLVKATASDLVQALDGDPFRFSLADVHVQAHRLDQLAANGMDRAERGHRFLGNEGDFAAANGAHALPLPGSKNDDTQRHSI